MRGFMLAQVRPKDLVPVAPAIAEPTTGETMGAAAERMAKENAIRRADQDAWALRSHQLAATGTAGAESTDIVGIEHRQITAVFSTPVDRTEQVALSFRGIFTPRHKYRLACVVPFRQLVQITIPSGEIVVRYRIETQTTIAIGGSTVVAMVIIVTRESLIQTRKLSGYVIQVTPLHGV